MSLKGTLHLDIQNMSYTAAMFNDFVDTLLDNMNPFPMQNSVLVMDNASHHISVALQELIEAR